ncbi:MAG: hypothetical protein IJ310_03685 [Clostridia bacterium]|nr:hypothetical protein [Clostridia bacterium]
MKKFFIFLDIDGVMYDWDFIKAEVDGGNTSARELKQFKPESIEALNLLMDTMRETHKVQLVISSTMRDNAIRPLYQNGAHLKGAVYSTPLLGDPAHRGLEIISFLEKWHLEDDEYDLVIIDDESFDFKTYFTDDQIIKPNIFKGALSVDMVKNYMRKKGYLKEEKAPETTPVEKQ